MPKPSKPFPPAMPQIPANVLQRLQNDEPPFTQSLVFSEEFNHYRHLIAALELEPDCNIPDTYLARPLASAGFEVAQSQTNVTMSWLHLAAMKGDILLAYEMIRMGASLSAKDDLGRSPLYFGCYMLSTYSRDESILDEASSLGFGAALTHQMISQIARICILLVEQHSDVNETHNGISLLRLACASHSWELIRVLLTHAANPTPPGLPSRHYPIMAFKTDSEKERYTSLIPTTPKTRPLRPCPCWSGKNLEDCHADGTQRPYPSTFLCICMSRKVYKKCCEKKGIKITEEWYPPGLYILATTSTEVSVSDLPESAAGFLRAVQQNEPKMTTEGVASYMHIKTLVLKRLVSSGQVDPAYAHAAENLDFIPSPWSSLLSKVERTGRVEEWNDLVDQYIASGRDKRNRVEVENVAKIGLEGGPLYRRCEDTGCQNLEGRNGVKIYTCTGCHKTVYCSRTCQERAWSAHRAVCKSNRAEEQLLPSQAAFRVGCMQTCTDLIGSIDF